MSAFHVILALMIVFAVTTLVAVIFWALTRGKLKDERQLNDSLKNRLSEVYELPAVTDALGVPDHIALVINPTKSGAKQAKLAVEQFAKFFGIGRVITYETAADDPGASMTRNALRDGAELVLAAGGDGTIREVAEVLSNSSKKATMGIIPLGTGNLLSRNLQLPINDIDRCIAIAFSGVTRTVDTVELAFENEQGRVTESRSTVIAGVGLDAEIMDNTNDALKYAAGWLAYTEAGMRKLPGRRKSIRLQLDDGPVSKVKVRSVMVANCGLLTGGIELAPEAKIDDGLLDVVLLSPRTIVDWTRVAINVASRGRAGTKTHLAARQAKKVRIELSEPMAAQIDGDGIGRARALTAWTKPSSLRVRVPRVDEPAPVDIDEVLDEA